MYYQQNGYNGYYVAQPTRKWYNPNRFTARAAAIAFFLSALLLTGMQFFFGYFVQISLPYATDIVFTFCSQGLMLAIALVMAKTCRVSLMRGGGDYAEKPYGSQIGAAILLLLGVTWVVGPLSDLLPKLMFTEEQLEIVLGNNPESPMVLVYFICIVTLPAICEELVFRGVICRGLTEWGKVPAVILSALAFMLMHANPMQTVHQFVGGIVMGIMMVETGNIVLCMIFHALNNGLGGLLSFATLIENKTAYKIVTALLILIGIICFFYGLRLILAKIKEAEGYEIPLSPMLVVTERQKKYVREMNHKQQGDYYYAVKEEVFLSPPMPGGEKTYQDRTEVYTKKEPFRQKGKEKWFYTQQFGWQPMNASSHKAKAILWFCLGAAINLAMLLYLFFKIKTL